MNNKIDILRSNMAHENPATQAILQIACNFWAHRNEFIYSSGTALERQWEYWSCAGYTDKLNTGFTISPENAGFKRIDCSCFARYIINGIDYYSTPYYNALELTEVQQGGLADGAYVPSDDVTLCRSGNIPVRPGKKLILKVKSDDYAFTKIFGYDASGKVIQTIENPPSNTVFLPDSGVECLRAEMKVAAPEDYAPAASNVPAAILKCMRIREEERLEINADCPLPGHRNANEMCKWFDENGYAVEFDPNNLSLDNFRPGTVLFWGRDTGTWAYKCITHVAIYIGSGYILHVCDPGALIGGEAIHIETVDTLINRYKLPMIAASSPKYHHVK